MQLKKKISIITPVLNEEENLPRYFTEVKSLIDALSQKYDFEIIFTDNASKDKTFEFLSKEASKDQRIKVLRLSKNFGYQKSILTGYQNSTGDAAIELDADLQDPPDLIREFLSVWEDGAKIVYGIRESRQEALHVTFLRKLFYKLIDRVSSNDLPHNAGDFMLLDRQIVEIIKDVNDNDLYLRGIVFSLGFKRYGIKYSRDSRKEGTSKFPIKKMFNLAFDGISSQSTVMLHLASYVGILLALLASLGCILIVVLKLTGFLSDWPRGFTSTTLLIVFSLSFNAIFLGIIGNYLGRIYLQLKKRPNTIVEKSINF